MRLRYASLVPLLLVPVLVILALLVLVPISIVQRFRMGTARRPARGWVAALNLLGVAVSAALFFMTSLISSRWIPDAPAYTVAGLGVGAILGLIGFTLTRWQYGTRGRLEYTPNRWLVLAVTSIVAARIVYGFWRSWYSWQGGVDSMAWIAASGVAGSMSAGAVVLGYYLTFWAGVHRRAARAPGGTRGERS